MTTEGSSTLVRRQLGRRLRRLREGGGKTIEDVIAANVVSRTKLWRIESGRTVVKQGDVLALVRLYGGDLTDVGDLLTLADATKATGYLEEFGAAVPESLGIYADLEASAAAIADYNSELITGLLQTADYARAVTSVNGALSPEVVEQRVGFRLQRQRLFFDRPRPGQMDAVVTEGALNVQVASPVVMEEQRRHLRELASRDGVSVCVLPFERGLHAAMRGPFTVMDFDDESDPSLVYVENLIGSRYIERPEYIAQFRSAFNTLRAQAVPIEEYSR